MKLISMVEFVLEQSIKIDGEKSKAISYDKIENYSEFLKQPLKLSMFVPCDEESNVLGEPKIWKDYLNSPESLDGYKGVDECYIYEIALEKIIFEGWEIGQLSIDLKIISKDKLLLKFYNKGTSVFLHDHKEGRVAEIKTIEELTPYNLKINKKIKF